MRLGSLFARSRAHCETAPVARTQFSAARSHVGRVRTVNEDRMLEAPDRGLWAVADGMGGHSGGDIAAGIVIDALTAVAENADMINDDAVVAALHSANLRIAGRSGGAAAPSGTTAVVARIRDGIATIWWVGDSRAYQIRGGGAVCLTRDHSLVQELIDAGSLSESQADRHPQRNVITRAIGIGDDLRIAVVETPFEAADVLLLCSDGVSRSLRADDFLAPCASLDDLADTLLHNALQRDGTDNATAIVIQNRREHAPDDLRHTIQ